MECDPRDYYAGGQATTLFAMLPRAQRDYVAGAVSFVPNETPLVSTHRIRSAVRADNEPGSPQTVNGRGLLALVEHVRVFFAEGFGARGRVRAAPPTAASGSSAARPAPACHSARGQHPRARAYVT